MFSQNIPSNISLFKSPDKDFMMITRVFNRKDGIMIKRNICYFDMKTKRYIKRTEIQQFNCTDNDKIQNKLDSEADKQNKLDQYCQELQIFAKMYEEGNTLLNESSNHLSYIFNDVKSSSDLNDLNFN